MDGFDISDLNAFNKQLVEDMKKKYPQEVKKFLKKEANKVQEVAKNIAKNEIKENTGNYLKGFKVGKSGLKGKYTIKAYNQAPHGHLIEDGYNQVARGENKSKGSGRRKGTKPTGKFVEGKKIYLRAQVKFKPQFEKDVEDFAGDLLYKSVCEKHTAQMAKNLGVTEKELEKYL